MPPTRTISLPDTILAKAIAAYIHAGCRSRKPLHLSALAKKFAVSETKLKSVFRVHYRQSIHGFVITERMKYVKELLQQTNHPVKMVAHMAGYTETSNCSRDFTRVMGMSPLACRKQWWSGMQRGEMFGRV